MAKQRKRWRVGFYTARHPEIDGRLSAGVTSIILWQTEVLAYTHNDAIGEAKAAVNVCQLEYLVKLRWPAAKCVGYTWDEAGAKGSRATWGKVQGQVEFDALRNIQAVAD